MCAHMLGRCLYASCQCKETCGQALPATRNTTYPLGASQLCDERALACVLGAHDGHLHDAAAACARHPGLPAALGRPLTTRRATTYDDAVER